MLFSALVKELGEIEKTTLRNEMMVRLADLIRGADSSEVKELVYLTMGTLRPKFDRLEFSVADKMVVRAIARVYGKTPDEVMKIYKEMGDLGEVVQHYSKAAVQQKHHVLEVVDVYKELEMIARDNGMGSQERKIERLAKLLASMDDVQAKYLVRIVLGKLRLGFSDKTILDALSYMEKGSKEAREDLDLAYQVAPDVAELSKIVKESGSAQAKELVVIKLGRPMMPALAQRLRTADEMIAKMGTVQVEPKYDGTRVQIHFSRREKIRESRVTSQEGLFAYTQIPKIWVKTFTRNLDENTEMFPELQKMAEQVNAQEIILDSEAVGYDPQTGALVPFQMTITRKRKHGIEAAVTTVPLKFYVFDILYKDGASLIRIPLHERRKILLSTITGEGVMVVDDAITTDNPQELRDFHKKQLLAGLEGALVKKIDGLYLPGRQDWNWVKFKEEEGQAGKLSDTVDAVVMGYYVGKGKRQKFGIGAFLVGIRDEETKNIYTIAKIGTGLSDEQFVELYSKLTDKQTKEKMSEYVVDKNLEPDVWVEPQVIVEVAADEVTVSPIHTSGYALRFPRLVRFRDDKTVDTITTLSELKEIAGV